MGTLEQLLYRGRHRRPTSTGRVVRGAVAAGAVAAAPLAIAAPAQAAAPTGVLDVVAQCETGDRNIESVSPISSASGHWQFVDGTWRRFGGEKFAPRAIGATRAEQKIVAERAFAANGLRDWEASRPCWGPKLDGRHAAGPDRPATVAARSSAAPRHALVEDVYTVVRGDTLGEIATSHGTTGAALFHANRDVIDHPDRIFPGERLRV